MSSATVIASLTVTLVCDATAVIVSELSVLMRVSLLESEIEAAPPFTVITCPTTRVAPETPSTTRVVEPDNAPLTVITVPALLSITSLSPGTSLVPSSNINPRIEPPSSSVISEVPLKRIAVRPSDAASPTPPPLNAR